MYWDTSVFVFYTGLEKNNARITFDAYLCTKQRDMPININITVRNPELENLFITFKKDVMDKLQELSLEIAEVQAEVVALRADVAAEHEQVLEKLATLEEQNTALGEEIDRLQELLDGSAPEIQAAIDNLRNIKNEMTATREDVRSIIADTPPDPEEPEDPEV